eukprot:774649-Lingulodinium_polyedra.AAC.1
MRGIVAPAEASTDEGADSDGSSLESVWDGNVMGWSDTFVGVDPSQLWEKQVLGGSLDSSMDFSLVAATTAEPGGAGLGGAEATVADPPVL